MPRKSQPKYKVSLKLPDKTYSKTAPSIVEALDALNLDVKIGSKGVFEVQFGKLKAEIYLWPRMIRKLAINKLSKELFQKRMIGALK